MRKTCKNTERNYNENQLVKGVEANGMNNKMEEYFHTKCGFTPHRYTQRRGQIGDKRN